MIEAERLSALFSEKFGTRSLDILHVAAALVLGEPLPWNVLAYILRCKKKRLSNTPK